MSRDDLDGVWPAVRVPGSAAPAAPTGGDRITAALEKKAREIVQGAAAHNGVDLDAAAPRAAHNRRVTLTRASSIKVRPVRWAWQGRVPLGALSLVAGREGIGKSSVTYTLAAAITRGTLPGVHHGKPRAIVVCATEDSWAHTIVPRLMAAGADLDLVLRTDVVTSDNGPGSLSLPADLTAVERALREVNAALLLLDPLMSRLDATLDSHKDQEVRQALEPLTALADRTSVTIFGIIHVNKGIGNDPLTSVMGSRAFTAVARSVLYVMRDPEDDAVRLLGQAKNNLGRDDLPTLTFALESVKVADTDEGEVWTSRVRWTGESSQRITEALAATVHDPDTRTQVEECSDWLRDYLTGQGGQAPYRELERAADKAGFALSTLKRARARSKVVSRLHGFPKTSTWFLPGGLPSESTSEEPDPSAGRSESTSSESTPGESELTELTGLISPTGVAVSPVGPVGPVRPRSQEPEPTEPEPTGAAVLGPCVACGGVTVRHGAAGHLLCPPCQHFAQDAP